MYSGVVKMDLSEPSAQAPVRKPRLVNKHGLVNKHCSNPQPHLAACVRVHTNFVYQPSAQALHYAAVLAVPSKVCHGTSLRGLASGV